MKPLPSTTTNDAIDVIQDEIADGKMDIDSFYLIPCEWPEIVEGDTPQDNLYQFEEIMNKYRPCFIRHNGLVEVLRK